MLGKVRPITHRGNGSVPQPEVGLSDGRLALVHRYMIDAEEAEARARAAAEADDARPQAGAFAAAPARSAPKAQRSGELRRAPVDPQRARPRREEWVAGEAKKGSALVGGADQVARNVSEVAEPPNPKVQIVTASAPSGQSARTLRAVAKEERRAAKHAAQALAALEKREARERKALAKAAARRRPKGIAPSQALDPARRGRSDTGFSRTNA